MRFLKQLFNRDEELLVLCLNQIVLNQRIDKIMTTLEDLKTSLAAEEAVEADVIKSLAQLSAQQSDLTAVKNSMDADTAALKAAQDAANPAPAPTPAP